MLDSLPLPSNLTLLLLTCESYRSNGDVCPPKTAMKRVMKSFCGINVGPNLFDTLIGVVCKHISINNN
jgi:hypothetical protein